MSTRVHLQGPQYQHIPSTDMQWNQHPQGNWCMEITNPVCMLSAGIDHTQPPSRHKNPRSICVLPWSYPRSPWAKTPGQFLLAILSWMCAWTQGNSDLPCYTLPIFPPVLLLPLSFSDLKAMIKLKGTIIVKALKPCHQCNVGVWWCHPIFPLFFPYFSTPFFTLYHKDLACIWNSRAVNTGGTQRIGQWLIEGGPVSQAPLPDIYISWTILCT